MPQRVKEKGGGEEGVTRIEQKSERKVAGLLVLPRACRMAEESEEKLEHIGPARYVTVASAPQNEQLAWTQEPH